ncbi:hypothetical protein [Ammoniphilus sp. YIM 78166]|nr:hypothetical protein [Ammoniphilus sp. YIM 78166]
MEWYQVCDQTVPTREHPPLFREHIQNFVSIRERTTSTGVANAQG